MIAQAAMKMGVAPTVNDATVGYEVLAELTRKVMRAFYDGPSIVLMDMLLAKAPIKDDDLRELMKFQKKQLTMYLKPLELERMVTKKRITAEPELEFKEGHEYTIADFKGTANDYYWINFKGVVDAVTYRFVKMKKQMEEAITAVARFAFECKTCGKKFGDMEAATGHFRCARCGVRLERIDAKTEHASLLAREKRLNEQLDPIGRLLEQTQQFTWHVDADGNNAILTEEELKWKLNEEEETRLRQVRQAKLGMGAQRITVDIRPSSAHASREAGGMTELPAWMVAPAVPPPSETDPQIKVSRFAIANEDLVLREARIQARARTAAAQGTTVDVSQLELGGGRESALARSQRLVRKLDEVRVRGASSSDAGRARRPSARRWSSRARAGHSRGPARGPAALSSPLSRSRPTAHRSSSRRPKTSSSSASSTRFSRPMAVSGGGPGKPTEWRIWTRPASTTTSTTVAARARTTRTRALIRRRPPSACAGKQWWWTKSRQRRFLP
ncbi:uncharacterized protein AMSG_12125 [Thecamonas trahens ATCC 50062]|uniref:C2H2-type domain-containing protein n=1 Tax=Thecamonas trahens ATCC 50062 TaxID=461836 RepID=A0A0L0DJ83_THETB|nr:hypothetical protein AMSG_12125 [Thecamonas trahens ATCC 50062]KNC52464.1 hypothetical protein AMSG_12125 [Thecamonas trahens ATCC 50062]|eukprot:XP_013755368.1 hypothetical protein AMSG_12125 [Thecamonas trahens ATCC 50062]